MGDNMEIFKIILLCLLSITILLIIIFAFLSKKPIRILLLNSFLGVLILFFLFLIKNKINIFIPINQYTVFSSLAFGVPAVIGFLIFNLIFL